MLGFVHTVRKVKAKWIRPAHEDAEWNNKITRAHIRSQAEWLKDHRLNRLQQKTKALIYFSQPVSNKDAFKFSATKMSKRLA